MLLRVTPSNPEAERQRHRVSSDVALEARITKDAAGDIARLTVIGGVTPRHRVLVSDTTTEAGRATALDTARFGPASAADVRSLARARAGRTSAADPTASDPTLVWHRIGVQQEAVWEIRMQLPTKQGMGEYLARFSAGDGTLVNLERVAAEREVVR